MLTRLVLRDEALAKWLTFADPVAVVTAREPRDVAPALAEAEVRVRDEGLYAAGFVCYEAAPGFDEAYVTKPPGSLPLLCFGLFEPPQCSATLPPGQDLPEIGWAMSTRRDRYVTNVRRIHEEIAAGNTYQVNYSVRQGAAGVRDPWSLFLQAAADAPHAAYIECGEHTIVSASPELFFELDGGRIVCRPMKGTAPRGMTTPEDRRLRGMLAASAKDRAENVMIADMVRNDLGRIASPGSIRAARLFEIEKYRTVWQMTSTVTARTDANVADVFRALFPSASITGAPKVSSMKLIAELEDSPREIYTGAIGFIAPGRKARFNVAIRTAVIDSGGRGRYGVGGGIVWDSDPEDEYQECLNKSIPTAGRHAGADFRLLETLLWRPGEGYVLLEEHLERLADSAEYFDFRCDVAGVRQRLDVLGQGLSGTEQRVRLLLSRDGVASLEAAPFERTAAVTRLGLASQPVNRRDPFLYHKTTERTVYGNALRDAVECDDVLLWNPESCVTESTVANFVARIDGRLCTPPVECGLLAGTLRRRLLEDGVLVERKILVSELPGLEECYLVNSVRGMRRCRLTADPGSRGATSGTATAGH